VSMNQEALEHLRRGQELVASEIFKRALAYLSVIKDVMDDIAEPQLQGMTRNSTFGLELVILPSFRPQEVPCAVVSIAANGFFSRYHGLASTQWILLALLQYHSAVAIHRGCRQSNVFYQTELVRSLELYESSEFTVIHHVPEIGSMKVVVDSSIGLLHALFNCSAAA
jgi:hypothetical protein